MSNQAPQPGAFSCDDADTKGWVFVGGTYGEKARRQDRARECWEKFEIGRRLSSGAGASSYRR